MGAPDAPVVQGHGTTMPQLDALRAFAVAAVLVHHYAPGAQLPAPLNFSWGFLGVRLFFVLSGFLITGILLRARDQALASGTPCTGVLRAFYARRALRIFPLYYFVILACAMLNVQPVREEWPWLVTYTFNLRVSALGWFPQNIAHFWSLAVEEQFYLLWPVIVLFAPRSQLVKIALGMIALGVTYRVFAVAYELSPAALYVFTAASFDALGAGCVLAIVCNGRQPSRELVRKLTVVALPAGAGAGVLLQWLNGASHWGPYLHVFLFDAAAALLFVWAVAAAAHGFGGRAKRLLEAAPLLHCGRIAYGIYVYHLLLLPGLAALVAPWKHQPVIAQSVQLLVGTLLSIGIATLSWHLLEQPLNKLKRNFPYVLRRERHGFT